MAGSTPPASVQCRKCIQFEVACHPERIVILSEVEEPVLSLPKESASHALAGTRE
jgi:hypothetical protein